MFVRPITKYASSAFAIIFPILSVFSQHPGDEIKVERAETSWYDPVVILKYTSFTSVTIVQYILPELTANAMWIFTSGLKSGDCQEDETNVYLRYGSFPIINQLNESFPDNFNLQTTFSTKFIVSADEDNSTFVHLSYPRAGHWYAGYVLKGKASDKIQQQGLFTPCIQQLEVQMRVEMMYSVKVIQTSTITPLTIENGSSIFRYNVGMHAWQFSIHVFNCSSVTGDCPITMAALAGAVPSLDSPESSVIKCENLSSSECNLIISSPEVLNWYYIKLYHNLSTSLNISIYIEENTCSDFELEDVSTLYTLSDEKFFVGTAFDLSSSSEVCAIIPEMGREVKEPPFSVEFKLRYGFIVLPNILSVLNEAPIIVSFSIHPINDIGGTLWFKYGISHDDESSDISHVRICIQRGRLPIYNGNISCTSSHMLTSNSSQTKQETEMFFPYPESGKWFVGFQSVCYNSSAPSVEIPCNVTVHFEVQLEGCVKGKCENGGNCYEYYSNVLHYTSCRCTGGYRGYGCTDSTNAISKGEMLLSTLLLTLSNLAFLPAVILAVYRRHFVAVLSYTFTMFCSTFYHACDGEGLYLWCLAPYNVLSFCDFYASIMSFWVTLVLMSKLPIIHLPITYMFGALWLSVAVTWNKHSLVAFLIPVLIGLVMLAFSWGRKIYTTKKIYPSKKRWLFYIVPGLSVALVGLILFAFFETKSNYKFIHSTWHVCMGLCILFLLPPALGNNPESGCGFSEKCITSSTKLLKYIVKISRKCQFLARK